MLWIIDDMNRNAHPRGSQPSLTVVGMKSWLSIIHRTSEFKFRVITEEKNLKEYD